MKFKKLFFDGYVIEYRGVHIVVRKERGCRQWLAQAKVKDGLKFIDDTCLDGMYSRDSTRKGAVEDVIAAIDDRASFVLWFRNFCAFRQEFNYVEELNLENLLRDCDELLKDVRK